MGDIADKKVAILVSNYFEEAELAEPKAALEAAGVTVHIVAPEPGEVQAMENDTDKTNTYPVDRVLNDTTITEYDALVVPGGTVNSDKLRVVPAAQQALKDFMATGRPVAIICHGPWSLISAGLAKDKQLTSFPSLRDDLENAGATWVDKEVVIDGNLITSRNPDDLPAFNTALLTMLSSS